MMYNSKLIVATTVLALVAMTAPAFAWMGDCSGTWMNHGMGTTTSSQALPAEQQKQVDEIQNTYQPQLQDLQQKLNAKQSELSAARNDDSTTVGRLKVLESELYTLERSYWSRLNQANLEMNQITGSGYGSWFSCGYQGCDHGDNRHGMMQNGYMTRGHNMSGGQYGSCCW